MKALGFLGLGVFFLLFGICPLLAIAGAIGVGIAVLSEAGSVD